MSIREQVSNFKFFEVIAPHKADPSVTAITGATVDTQGYETCAFTIQHSVISLASAVDPITVHMQHASNSTTGVDDIGAWSYVSAEHVYGLDIYRLMSVQTIDSWLATDRTERSAYKISVTGNSGLILSMAISVTSMASCLTNSYMPMIAYLGPKRWVRITMSCGTNISYTNLAAHAFLGLPANWPILSPE